MILLSDKDGAASPKRSRGMDEPEAAEDCEYERLESTGGGSGEEPVRLITIGPDEAGLRVDTALARLCPKESRSSIQRLIREGRVKVDDRPVKPGLRTEEGWEISIRFHPPRMGTASPEDLPIEILYEDEHIVVVNKPAGMASHPAPGSLSGTLVNALLHHCPGLSQIGGVQRPGIVHRLDKGTSGVMVVSKSDEAHRNLASQFKARRVTKSYITLVWDNITEDEGTMESPIGRDMKNRKKMSVRTGKPREAYTHFRVLKRYGLFTLLEVSPRTGRTHQIRVHLAHMRHPVVGDPLYGRKAGRAHLPPVWKRLLSGVNRPLLHARRITFLHPVDGTPVEFTAPLPDDFLAFMEENGLET